MKNKHRRSSSTATNATQVVEAVHQATVDDFINHVSMLAAAKKDASDLSMLARQVEVQLGECERQGVPTKILDAGWGRFCEACLKRGVELGVKPTTEEQFDGLLFEQPEFCLNDNYFDTALELALAAKQFKSKPALAWAACSKNSCSGFRDEIACIRLLLWAGFDPNAQEDESKNTALHYLSYVEYSPGSHLRGVRLLLEAGANPNAQNICGDTPLTYLCGSKRWSPDLHKAALILVKYGADPSIAANDGETSISLIQQDHPERKAADTKALMKAFGVNQAGKEVSV